MSRNNIIAPIYRHYKGNYYSKLFVSKIASESLQPKALELVVVYRALYFPYRIFCRPKVMFDEQQRFKMTGETIAEHLDVNSGSNVLQTETNKNYIFSELYKNKIDGGD